MSQSCECQDKREALTGQYLLVETQDHKRQSVNNSYFGLHL
jgi:hypothetical protein